MQIRLMGRPAIVGPDGLARPLRGQQVWAVLARIVLSPRPLDRRTLAMDLFPETEDPLGALRWCLASLRRALDAPDAFSGDPISPRLPDGVRVDVLEGPAAIAEAEDCGDLLEGIEPRCSPQFETWLLLERSRLGGRFDEGLRREAMLALEARDPARATRFAERAATRNPFDESGHVLLARSLVLAGRRDAAAAHVEEVEKLFLADLGVRPSPALRAALRQTPAGEPRTGTSAAVGAGIEAGLAAVHAGASDAGLDLLRQAASDAERLGDVALLARATVELGSALVHSVRGRDDEGAMLLAEALALARRSGQGELAARALREMGYVDAMAGRRPSAARYLAAARDAAAGGGKIARTLAVTAFNLVDWGRHDEGLALYREALVTAEAEQDPRTTMFTLGVGSWGHLAAGDAEAARDWAADCLARVDQANWLAFRPFPAAMLGEARLALGEDPGSVRHDLEPAFALGCQLRDPCWEGATARAIALSYARENDVSAAREWLTTARYRTQRETDVYVALLVQILADHADVDRAAGDASGADWMTRKLLALAARTHADHHVRRALRHLSFGEDLAGGDAEAAP